MPEIDYNLKYREDTVGAVTERLTAALRVAGLIPTRNKYLNGLEVVVPGQAISIFVNAPTIQELFLVQRFVK